MVEALLVSWVVLLLQVGQADIIRLLAEWDADMEETDSIRRGRPLMHAANNGHTAAVKAMTECGADPEATDDNGYTALMVAVFSDRWAWEGARQVVSCGTTAEDQASAAEVISKAPHVDYRMMCMLHLAPRLIANRY